MNPLRQSLCSLLNWIPSTGLVMYTHLLYSLSSPSLLTERYPSPEHQTILVWLRKKKSKTPIEVHSVPNYIRKYQHVSLHIALMQHPKCLKRRKVGYFQLISSSMWQSCFWQFSGGKFSSWTPTWSWFCLCVCTGDPYGVNSECPITSCFWRKQWQNK